jgi:hypothetical protein
METTEERQAARQRIANEQNARVESARKMFGPAIAYGRWTLHDTLKQEPDRVVYCCQREDVAGWRPSYQEAFGDLLGMRTDKVAVVVKGVEYRHMRYQLWFGALAEYHPMDPAVLDKRNATRKQNEARKKLEKDKAQMPLLAAQIEGEATT